MKVLSLIILLASACFGQEYVTVKQTSLSGAVETITLQQPASSGRFVQLEAAYVSCSVACTITMSRDGSQATSTAGTIVNVNPSETAASSTVWTSSNVSGGTTIGKYPIPAAGAVVIDLSKKYFKQGSRENLSIATDSITGTVTIILMFNEKTI